MRWLKRNLDRLSERPDSDLKALEVIAWWELRRFPFNVVVGVSGVIACILIVSFSLAVGTVCGIPDPPIVALLGIFAFGVMANACYTAGWMAELLLFKSSDARRRFATRAFRWGFTFSVVIAGLPGLLIPLLCIVGRLVTGAWDHGP